MDICFVLERFSKRYHVCFVLCLLWIPTLESCGWFQRYVFLKGDNNLFGWKIIIGNREFQIDIVSFVDVIVLGQQSLSMLWCSSCWGSFACRPPATILVFHSHVNLLICSSLQTITWHYYIFQTNPWLFILASHIFTSILCIKLCLQACDALLSVVVVLSGDEQGKTSIPDGCQVSCVLHYEFL